MGFLFKAECSMIMTTGVAELINFPEPFSCRPQAIQNSFQPLIVITLNGLATHFSSVQCSRAFCDSNQYPMCTFSNERSHFTGLGMHFSKLLKSSRKAPENDFRPGKSRVIFPSYFRVPEIS